MLLLPLLLLSGSFSLNACRTASSSTRRHWCCFPMAKSNEAAALSRVSAGLILSAFGGLGALLVLRRKLLPELSKNDRSTRNIGETLRCFSPGGHFEGRVYLDWNATSPIFPEVTAAMKPFTWAQWGNPSSTHVFSSHCRQALSAARASVAAMLGEHVSPTEILFASCGSEADNHAIRAALAYAAHSSGSGAEKQKPHVITSAIEHPAILQYLQALYARGEIAKPTLLPVDLTGIVDLRALRNALRPTTVLVTIMHSNNEIGTLEPIADVVRIVNEYSKTNGRRILVHTDAAQSCGKVRQLLNCTIWWWSWQCRVVPAAVCVCARGCACVCGSHYSCGLAFLIMRAYKQ